MIQDEDSADSQDTLAAEEVDRNDPYEWDNYREDPSFIDPEEDPDFLVIEENQLPLQHTTRRQSSTDEQFLDHENPLVVNRINPFVFSEDQTQTYSHWPPRNPSEESDNLFAESLLPAGLLDPVREAEEEVFFDFEPEDSTCEVTMPPKAPPTAAQLHETFKDKVDEFDSYSDCVETTGATPDSETLSELDSMMKTVSKLASDLKKVDLNLATYFPEVEVENKENLCGNDQT